jgi:6-carboxyhexanoate--CoA ligase
MRIHQEGTHLSGAEELVPAQELEHVLASFSKRLLPHAFNNPTHPPQQIVTIDPVSKGDIQRKSLLPVQFLESPSCEESAKGLQELLECLLPEGQAESILEIFRKEIMETPPRHGALLVTSRGRPFLEAGTTGIRTTHLGCDPSLRKALEENLDHFLAKPNHRFIDALVLASKVLASESVLLEICVSDDPSYTTGYMASRLFGYVRIPHMKKPGIPKGGRLYVVSPTVHLPTLLRELRETPVLFDGQSSERIIKAHSRLKPIPSAEIRPPSQGTPR